MTTYKLFMDAEKQERHLAFHETATLADMQTYCDAHLGAMHGTARVIGPYGKLVGRYESRVEGGYSTGSRYFCDSRPQRMVWFPVAQEVR